MDALAASRLAELLWKAYRRVDPKSERPVLIRQLLTCEQAERLPRPWLSAGEGFGVALADGPNMRRFSDPLKASEENERHPRTRLYESVHTRPGAWPAVVAAHLAGWLGADVLSSVYEAEAKDSGLPEHRDAWDNIVLQLEGSKRWRFEAGDEVVLVAGDVLLVPTGTVHFVRTPARSVHINFEVIDPVAVATYMRDSTPVSSDA